VRDLTLRSLGEVLVEQFSEPPAGTPVHDEDARLSLDALNEEMAPQRNRVGEGIGNLNLAREIVEARCGTTCCTKRAIGPRLETRRTWREF
jgi:hypothetical protein